MLTFFKSFLELNLVDENKEKIWRDLLKHLTIDLTYCSEIPNQNFVDIRIKSFTLQMQ